LNFSIPSNSFSQKVGWNVSYAPVESHSLGLEFLTLTPIIRVQAQFLYSNYWIKIRVPVNIPEGYFAMGFLIDEESGRLEGIPLYSTQPNEIVVATRLFSIASAAEFNSSVIPSKYYSGSFVIAAIPLEKLKSLSALTTDYNPELFRWDFVAEKTFGAPQGMANAMNLSSYWSYRQKTEPRHLPGNFTRIFPSDPRSNFNGIKVNSTLEDQFGITVQRFSRDFGENVSGILQYYSACFALWVSGKPQFLILSDGQKFSLQLLTAMEPGTGNIKLITPVNIPVEEVAFINTQTGKPNNFLWKNFVGDNPTYPDRIWFAGSTSFFDFKLIAQFLKAQSTVEFNHWLSLVPLRFLNEQDNYVPLALIQRTKFPHSKFMVTNWNALVQLEWLNPQGILIQKDIVDPRLGNYPVLVPVNLGLNVFYCRISAKSYEAAEYEPFLLYDFVPLNCIRGVDVTVQSENPQVHYPFGSVIQLKAVLSDQSISKANLVYVWALPDGSQQIITGSEYIAFSSFGSYSNQPAKVSVYVKGQSVPVGSGSIMLSSGLRRYMVVNSTSLEDFEMDYGRAWYDPVTNLTTAEHFTPSLRTINFVFPGKATGVFQIGGSNPSRIYGSIYPNNSFQISSGTIEVVRYDPVKGLIVLTYQGQSVSNAGESTITEGRAEFIRIDDK
jgi:hypothetical protein